MHTLKIDRSFVGEIGQDIQTTAMVRGIIAFAKNLGLTVTGEGVETAEQSAQLRAMGCDWGQGYLFAKPLSTTDMDTVLARRLQPPPALGAQPDAAAEAAGEAALGTGDTKT